MLVKTPSVKTSLQTGFTLVELIITLSVVAVLIFLAVPAFNDLIQQTRLTSATSALHNAMNLARTEAIKRNDRVDLIPHNGDWKNGWKILAGTQLIFNQEALHKDIQISSTFPNKKNPYIAYGSTGRTRTTTSSNGTLSGTLRLSYGKYSRSIVVNFLGRARVCNPANAVKSCTEDASDN